MTTIRHKGKAIAKFAEIYKTPWKKAKGMMFEPSPRFLIFTFRKPKLVSLHNLFVFFPLDILFLNDKKKVVEIKEDFRPFSFYFPFNKAKYIIEAPKKTVRKHKIKVGHKVSFKLK